MRNINGFQIALITGMGMIIFLELGVLKAFGVFVNDIIVSLDTSTSLVGTAVGLSHGLSLALAVVVPWLMKHISRRRLTMVGSVLGSLGYILASFCRTGPQFLMCLILSGIGYGAVLFTSHSSLLVYLPNIYSIITSVIYTAGGVGMMTLPILAEYLRSIYTWRGALLLLGGLSLNCVACSALFRPPETLNARSGHEDNANIQRKGNANEESFDDDADTPELSSSHPLLASDTHERDSPFLDLFRTYPLYITILIAIFTNGIAYNAWIVFLVPNAEAKGFAPGDAVFLATLGGAGNIAGRLVIGFFSARKILDDRWTFCILQAFSALLFFLNNLTKSFLVLAFLAVGNGFASGCLIVIIACIAQSIFPSDLVAYALSLHYLMFLGEVAGGALMGWLHDTYNSYDVAFIAVGLLDILAILVIIIPVGCHKLYRLVIKSVSKKL